MAEQPSRLLVVDDDASILAVVERFAGALGFEVIVRSNGEDALACLASVQPDAALVDLQMPGIGGLDVLLFGAATHDATATVPELEESVWDQVLRVNLTGAYLVSKACLPVMIKRGGGSIILIASQLGRVASPGRAAYCTTKGGLIQLAKVMAADHAAQGIRVNTLSPGAVETDRLVRRWGDMDKAREILAPKHLLGRLGQPDEIARAALFLASPASSFMTGADLLVDGGYTAI